MTPTLKQKILDKLAKKKCGLDWVEAKAHLYANCPKPCEIHKDIEAAVSLTLSSVRKEIEAQRAGTYCTWNSSDNCARCALLALQRRLLGDGDGK